ncbi:MAG: LysR family transcriptional regulator [Magnetococcales bacterium]|nr:LysR family transcriptional regulator [Magnetococcales bacterium]
MDRLACMESFVRVVESGSFAAAARKSGLSRSAVSKYIETLESHLGVRLINRTTRQLHLTTEGELYYPYCRRILEDVDEAEQSVSHLHATPRGLLRVSAPVSFGTRYLAPATADFLLKYPGIELDLVLNDRFVDLIEEGFDLAVRIGTLEDSTLMARRLTTTRLIPCASPTYLAKHGKPTTPADLTRHVCLLYSYTASPNVWRFRHQGEEHSVRITGPLRANNGEALCAAARAGLGVALLPGFLVDEELRLGVLEPLLTDYSLPTIGIHAVCPSNRHLSTKVREFIDFLASRFRP